MADNFCVNCKHSKKSYDEGLDCHHPSVVTYDGVTGTKNVRSCFSVRLWDCEGRWYGPTIHTSLSDNVMNTKFIPWPKSKYKNGVPVITFGDISLILGLITIGILIIWMTQV